VKNSFPSIEAEAPIRIKIRENPHIKKRVEKNTFCRRKGAVSAVNSSIEKPQIKEK
jgi:hypothetical protein